MLERKRMLKVKEQIVRDGKRVFIYEQPKTGDIFTIADPDLRLDQLEAVQRDVAALLEHGLNPPVPRTHLPRHNKPPLLKMKLRHSPRRTAGCGQLKFRVRTLPNFKTVSACNSATKICCAWR